MLSFGCDELLREGILPSMLLYINTPNDDISLPSPVIMPMRVEASPAFLKFATPQNLIQDWLELFEKDQILRPHSSLLRVIALRCNIDGNGLHFFFFVLDTSLLFLCLFVGLV